MDREEIIEDLIEHYSKDTLTCLLMMIGVEPDRSYRKFDLSMVLVDRLMEEQNLEVLFNRISPVARTVLKHLTWEGVSTLRDIDTLYGIKSCVDDFYYNSSDPFISIFKSKYTREIQLSAGIRYLFKRHFKPEEIDLSVDLDGVTILPAPQEIIDCIDGVWEFIEARQISDREVSKSLYKKDIKTFMKEYQLTDSFYEISSEIVLRFLSFREGESYSIKDYFLSYYRGNLIEDNLDRFFFFPFIKGLNSINSIDLFLKRARYAFISYIKKLSGWNSVDSVVRILSHREETHLFDTSWFGSLMEVKVSEEFRRDFAPTISLQMKKDNETLLLKPMLRGILTVLHMLGGVELGINPSNREFGVSSFESVICFKLTKRGLYLLDEISSWSEPSKADEVIHFNSTFLLVEYHGKQSSITNFLKRVSRPRGSGLYSISADSFMKEITDEKTFYYNLEKLEEMLGESPERHWEEFLNRLRERLYPTYNELQMIVINFPRDNSEFLDLVQHRDDIRGLYLMVEDYRAAFTTSAYKEFKRLIKESGFII